MDLSESARPTPLICFVVLSVVTVAFFVGLQSPVTSARTGTFRSDNPDRRQVSAESVLPATGYAEMPAATKSSTASGHGFRLRSSIDPLTVVKISYEEKLIALAKRDQNRAFNGAPPTIPHPVDQLTSSSCASCHLKGARTDSLRIPRMSHRFLANCTQCHIENRPKHMSPAVFRENEFSGLQAPLEGPRAFAGAPPQVPHSTWMRDDCLSCHGTSGLHGIRTTHPWRENCQQCHAPSAKMDQTLLPKPKFLPGPKIRN